MKRLSVAALKAIWRDQVFADRHLTPATFKVGYSMADFITMTETVALYMKSGRIIIFPSQDLLRRRANLAPDTVRAAIRDLILRGHLLKLRRGNQFSGSNQYRVVIVDRTED